MLSSVFKDFHNPLSKKDNNNLHKNQRLKNKLPHLGQPTNARTPTGTRARGFPFLPKVHPTQQVQEKKLGNLSFRRLFEWRAGAAFPAAVSTTASREHGPNWLFLIIKVININELRAVMGRSRARYLWKHVSFVLETGATYWVIRGGFAVDANNQPELPNPFADIGRKSVQPKGSGAGRLCKGRVGKELFMFW